MGVSQTLLAAVGDAEDIRTWSGIPYHLLQEARRQEVIDAGLPLSTDGVRWRMRRYVWNIGSVLRGRGRGGYQYSVGFLERLWAPVMPRVVGSRVINCFQLYPPSLVAAGSASLWFHLDQTLLQLFDTYGIRDRIGQQIARDALERERVGYERATGILMHSQWAADSVMNDYGIAPEKVFVVVPGANLDPVAYERWTRGRAAPSVDRNGPLRLIFVGKHPYRKGLDRLLRAFAMARARRADCVLRIIGCAPEDLPVELRQTEGVEWIGFIDKRRDGAGYLNAVADADVGCLLSRAEAGGIGLREYHALGLAVIGPDVGGSPDHVIRDAACLVHPDASDLEIAELIVSLERDRVRVQTMRSVSWERRMDVTWQSSVLQLAQRLNAATR